MEPLFDVGKKGGQKAPVGADRVAAQRARCRARARARCRKASVCWPASSSVSVDDSMAANRPDLVCMARTIGSMAASSSLGGADHEIGPFGHDLEVVVGHQRGDLDDDVTSGVESRHLEVHPHQHDGDVTGAARGSPRGRYRRAAR